MSGHDTATSETAGWIADGLSSREDIVSTLMDTSSRLSGSSRGKIRRLAEQISQLKTPDDVLRNPMALEIFLLLRKSMAGLPKQDLPREPAHATASNLTAELAVNRVLLSHLPIRAGTQRILAMLAYPIAVLSICGLVLAIFSWQLVPPFKSMFDEFGLSLPVFTELLFQISDVVQSPWTYVGLVVFVVCVGAFLWVQYGAARSRSGHASPVSFHGSGLRSTRGVWADWAWHVSLLMRAGLDKADAVQIAGAMSGQVWLIRGSKQWSQKIRVGENPFLGVTHFRGEACSLLANALVMDEDVRSRHFESRGDERARATAVQADLLRDVAEIYWDRDQLRTMWRLGWVSPLAVIGIGIVVLFVVFSLFAPLVELITGLT